jgi:hypothetical protein
MPEACEGRVMTPTSPSLIPDEAALQSASKIRNLLGRVPTCVYCDREMRLRTADSLTADQVYLHFACDICKWDVVLPTK